VCGPQRPQGEEASPEADAETEDQGTPDHVAPPPRQPARHGGGTGSSPLYTPYGDVACLLIILWLETEQDMCYNPVQCLSSHKDEYVVRLIINTLNTYVGR